MTPKPWLDRTITLLNEWCSFRYWPWGKTRAPGSGSISRKLQFSHLSEKLPPVSLLPQALRDNTEESLSLIFSSKEVLCQPMLIYDACDQAWCLRTSQSVILTVISLGAPASQGQPSNQVLEMDTLWKRKQWVKKMNICMMWWLRTRPPHEPSFSLPNLLFSSNHTSTSIKPGLGMPASQALPLKWCLC